MLRRTLIACAVGLGWACLGLSTAIAEDWNQHLYWPHNYFQQAYWSPYDYEQIYDSGNRYPKHLREYPARHGWRSWLRHSKPYHRGYHFVLDRF